MPALIIQAVSGVQTGADQVRWRAARAFVISTGVCMALGVFTDEGPSRDFAKSSGVVETPTADCPDRTVNKADLPDSTVWFCSTDVALLRAAECSGSSL
jgi:hypothetical protein